MVVSLYFLQVATLSRFRMLRNVLLRNRDYSVCDHLRQVVTLFRWSPFQVPLCVYIRLKYSAVVVSLTTLSNRSLLFKFYFPNRHLQAYDWNRRAHKKFFSGIEVQGWTYKGSPCLLLDFTKNQYKITMLGKIFRFFL